MSGSISCSPSLLVKQESKLKSVTNWRDVILQEEDGAGLHLFVEHTVSLMESLFGTTLSVQHPSGRWFQVASPPHCSLQHGSVLRVAHLGLINNTHPVKTGDLFILIRVQLPHYDKLLSLEKSLSAVLCDVLPRPSLTPCLSSSFVVEG